MRCAFHDLGCCGIETPGHEVEAVVSHLRLVLAAVLELRKNFSDVQVATGQAQITRLVDTVAQDKVVAHLRNDVVSSREDVKNCGVSDAGYCDLLNLLEDQVQDTRWQAVAPSHVVEVASTGSNNAVVQQWTEQCRLCDQPDEAACPSNDGHAPPISPDPTKLRAPPVSPDPSKIRKNWSPDRAVKQATEGEKCANPVPPDHTWSHDRAAQQEKKNEARAFLVSPDPTRTWSPDRIIEGAQTRKKCADNIGTTSGTTSSTTSGSTPDPQAILQEITSLLQTGKLSHAEARERFSNLIAAELPTARLRCSALLNRAHCLVSLGEHSAALEDIDQIIGTPGVDANQWHKVWMSRGGINRKLAQTTGDQRYITKAREDYEYVIAIQPANENYIAKAQRCLEALGRPAAAPKAVACSGREAQELKEPKKGRDLNAITAAPQTEETKRRRVIRKSPSQNSIPTDQDEEPSEDAVSCLGALGAECSEAGKALYQSRSVTERSAALSPGGIRPRIFDVASPERKGQSEVVALAVSSCKSIATGSNNANRKILLSKSTCSCRLRSHCKHIAAALCVLEAESDARQAPSTSPIAKRDDDVAHVRFAELSKRLERRTIDELKAVLRLNKQPLGGVKAELIRRVADGAIFGAIPICPKCNYGHLYFDGGAYHCRHTNRDKERCGYESSEVERRPFLGIDQL